MNFNINKCSDSMIVLLDDSSPRVHSIATKPKGTKLNYSFSCQGIFKEGKKTKLRESTLDSQEPLGVLWTLPRNLLLCTLA